MANNSSFLSPTYGDQSIENYIKTSLREAPDFTSADKAYGQLMSNPTLFARGGNFIDPTQAQQTAGSGFLQSRGQTAQDSLQNQSNLAGIGEGAANSLASIQAAISQLDAQQTAGQGGMFGKLLGGLF
jgi:hypothetical protein